MSLTVMEKIICKDPVNIKTPDFHLFEKGKAYALPQVPKPKVVTNVYLLRDVLFRFPFTFYTHESYVNAPNRIKVIKRLVYCLFPKKHLAKATWITNNWSKEYFHWFTEALPRLLTIQNVSNASEYPILLSNSLAQKGYVIESLNLLHISYIIYNKPVHIKQLILTQPTAPTGAYNPQLIQQLRNKLNKFTEKPTKYIYISRLKAERRKITNEEALIEILNRHQVEIHYFEDYSFQKQVELINQSRLLISIHGAGLTNMLFLPTHATVFELRNQGDTHNNCYYTLASVCELEYYYLENIGSSNNTFLADLTVNLTDFELLLNQILDKHL